jgi:hypothetical protein
VYLSFPFQEDSFVAKMNEFGREVGLNFSTLRGNSLPPASLQTFLAASSDIPGAVLTDHGSQYLNK